MPLTWDATRCADTDFITGQVVPEDDNGEQWHKTESLIFFTMIAGLRSEVTEETAADWYARITLYEKMHGAFVWYYTEAGERRECPFTPEDVRRRIGLSTNGYFGKKQTFAQFAARMCKSLGEDAVRRYESAAQEVTA